VLTLDPAGKEPDEAATPREDVARALAGRRRAIVGGLALGLPVSGVFLWLAIRGADLGEVRSALADATIAPLALALVAFGVVYSAQAERWRRIAATPDVGLIGFGEMVVSSIACNNVLPGRVGDLLRARWLATRSGMVSGRALATVVLDRTCDMVVLLVLLLATLFEVTGEAWSRRIAIGSVVLVLVLAVVLAAARMYTRRRDRGRLASRSVLRRILRDVLDGLSEPMGRRRLAAALLLSAVAWFAYAGAAICAGRSVGFHLGLVDALFTTAVLNLGAAIPSSPGFVGTYQWLGVVSLGAAGIAHAEALAFAILLQAVWYVPTTLLGSVSLVARGARTMTSVPVRRSGSGSAS
jgi:glycosyltransferase 2 family protein